ILIDVDVYALGYFPTNARAFVVVDGSAGNVINFDLRIMTDAGAVIELDLGDNDDSFGKLAPNIAGAPLLGTPTFLRINGPSAGTGRATEPYRIYAPVQPPLWSATVETEPNDTARQFTAAANHYLYRSL